MNYYNDAEKNIEDNDKDCSSIKNPEYTESSLKQNNPNSYFEEKNIENNDFLEDCSSIKKSEHTKSSLKQSNPNPYNNRETKFSSKRQRDEVFETSDITEEFIRIPDKSSNHYDYPLTFIFETIDNNQNLIKFFAATVGFFDSKTKKYIKALANDGVNFSWTEKFGEIKTNNYYTKITYMTQEKFIIVIDNLFIFLIEAKNDKYYIINFHQLKGPIINYIPIYTDIKDFSLRGIIIFSETFDTIFKKNGEVIFSFDNFEKYNFWFNPSKDLYYSNYATLNGEIIFLKPILPHILIESKTLASAINNLWFSNEN